MRRPQLRRRRADPAKPDDVKDLGEYEVREPEFFFEDGAVGFYGLFGGAEVNSRGFIVFVYHRVSSCNFIDIEPR